MTPWTWPSAISCSKPATGFFFYSRRKEHNFAGISRIYAIPRRFSFFLLHQPIHLATVWNFF